MNSDSDQLWLTTIFSDLDSRTSGLVLTLDSTKHFGQSRADFFQDSKLWLAKLIS